MAIEIEAKMRVADPVELWRRIESRFGPAVSERLEDNRFFDSPDDRLRLADCGLRIRSEFELATGQPARSVMTWKGPRLPGDLKQRQEIETPIADPDAAAAILSALGYTLKLRFEKRRRTWPADDCEIVLDEVPRIGWFLEIEGPGAPAIDAVRATLGLTGDRLEGRSYAALVREHLQQSGGGCELRF